MLLLTGVVCFVLGVCIGLIAGLLALGAVTDLGDGWNERR